MSLPGLLSSNGHIISHNQSVSQANQLSNQSINQSVNQPPLSSVLESLIGQLPYSDRHRLINDLLTLLHQTNSLKPVIASFPLNQPINQPINQSVGQSINLLNLTGTVPMFYKGTTYHIPVIVYLPYEYPFRPPHLYVTPTRDMRIKGRHKHVDNYGTVYLPYLNQWNSQSTLVDLIVIVSTVFSEDPPVFKVTQPVPSVQSISNQSVNQSPSSLHNEPVNHSRSQSTSQPVPPIITRPHSNSISLLNNQSINQSNNQSINPESLIEPLSPHTVRRKKLIDELTKATQIALREYSASSSSEIDCLLRENEKVVQHSEKMKQDMQDIQLEIDATINQSINLNQQIEILESWLLLHESNVPSINEIDEICQSRDSLSNQQIQSISQDCAYDDALFVLDRALNDDVIDLKQYIKNVRQLSKQQFYHRALTAKIFKIQQELPRLKPQTLPKSPNLPPRTNPMRPLR